MMASDRLAISLILATDFCLSGIAKLRSGRYVADLANYRILPLRTVIPVAITLPFLEIGLAGFILLWPISPLPIYMAAVALTVFAVAMTVNLLRGRTIACGCRGSEKPISWQLVGCNVVLAFVACVVAIHRPSIGGLNLLEGVATVGYVAVGGLAVQLLQHLRQLSSAARLLGLDTRPSLIAVRQSRP